MGQEKWVNVLSRKRRGLSVLCSLDFSIIT